MALPDYFVWTRYGTESGEAAESILARKEQERQAAGGVFLWGIGNSVGPSVRRLLLRLKGREPFVVFSPMLTPPRNVDVSPAKIFAWRSARGLDEQEWEMPAGTLVTSRGGSAGSEKSRHYALVCKRNEALRADDSGDRFALADLANFATGNPVGHSQVTAVVRRVGRSDGGSYVAAMTATLVFPYVVELSDPIALDMASRWSTSNRLAMRPKQLPLEVTPQSASWIHAAPPLMADNLTARIESDEPASRVISDPIS